MTERLSEEGLRAVLMGDSSELASMRWLLRRIPSPPHCKLCAAPFEGPGGSSCVTSGSGALPRTRSFATTASLGS